MDHFLQLLIAALTLGSIYALIALGFNLIFAASRLMNFAQGDLAMLGAMIGVTLVAGLKLPYPIAALLVAATVGVFFLLFQGAIIAPLIRRRATLTSMVMATLALSIFLQAAAQLIWGRLELRAPSPLGDQTIRLGGLAIVPHYILVLAVALGSFVVLRLLFDRTLIGKALLATGYEGEAARLVGINPQRMVMLSFVLGGGFAALGGLVMSPITFAAPWMGLPLAMKGFASAMVGGLGSVPGAFLGGMAVGLIETYSAAYVSSAYSDAFAFLLLMLVLFTRPAGMLGSTMVTGEHL